LSLDWEAFLGSLGIIDDAIRKTQDYRRATRDSTLMALRSRFRIHCFGPGKSAF
jgi:hypothetical protein